MINQFLFAIASAAPTDAEPTMEEKWSNFALIFIVIAVVAIAVFGVLAILRSHIKSKETSEYTKSKSESMERTAATTHYVVGESHDDESRSERNFKPGYDDLYRSFEEFRMDICAELIELYDRIKLWATVIMAINIVSVVAWLIAYIWANSLDERAVLELTRDDGVLVGLYVWITSSSLVYVIVAVAVAIIAGLIRRHYKYRSLYVGAMRGASERI